MVRFGTLGVQGDGISQVNHRRFVVSTFDTFPSTFETCGVSALAVQLQLPGT